MTVVTIAHLYPTELNTYGDSGNVIALRKLLEWRGYDVQVIGVHVGQSFDFTGVDMTFGGGGQDSGQLRVAQDLLRHGRQLRAAVEDGMPLLAVCGSYQLLGESFTTQTGQNVPGIGVFGVTTTGSASRMTGNVTIDSPFGILRGFENHSGETSLIAGQAPLGRVLKGFGNNTARALEGAIKIHAVGTYLHGPVLPNNPALADHLIRCALQRRHLTAELAALDDELELAAGMGAARRPQ